MASESQFKILLSAGASPAAYRIIRHLKELGHRVHAVDANEKAISLARSAADSAEVCPMAGHRDYLPFISDRIRQADVFIPFIDEEIARLLEAEDSTLWEKCLLPPQKTVETCLFKSRFQSFCLTAGLPVAKSVQRPPAVFKPDMGRGGRGVEFLDTPEQVNGKVHEGGVIQDRIFGEEFTIDALFGKDGDLIRYSARQRDAASGVSTIGTISDPEPFEHIICELAKAMKFCYLINIQVIRDAQGCCHIIEINPRIAGSVMFSVLSGVDFLKAAIEIFEGKTPAFPGVQRKIRVIRYWSEYVQDL